MCVGKKGVRGYLDDGSLPSETGLERLFLDVNDQVLGAGALGDLEGDINVDQGLSPLVREGYFVNSSFQLKKNVSADTNATSRVSIPCFSYWE